MVVTMYGIKGIEIAKYAGRARVDLSASVTHWTKVQGDLRAFDVLRKILRERQIVASNSEEGYIKAGQRAVCFSETPVTVMMRLFRQAECDRKTRMFLKWKPYGLSFLKVVLYQEYGGRPVLYLSQEEYHRLVIATGWEAETAWRVVNFDYTSWDAAVDFTHEREWRTPGDVCFATLQGDGRPLAVVDKMSEREELLREFPSDENCPVRGVLCLADIRALG
ncbi:MAG: hypothetical protein ACRELG_01210 [Gemmataceae bacterium]